MNYTAKITDTGLVVDFNNTTILNNLTIRANYMREYNILYLPNSVKTEGNKTEVEFTRSPVREWQPEANKVVLTLTETDNALLFFLNFHCNGAIGPGPYNYNFSPFSSVLLDFDYCGTAFTSLRNNNAYWLNVSFKNPKNIPHKMGFVSAKLDNYCANFLPVVNTQIASELVASGLEISTRVMHCVQIDSYVMSINVDTMPKNATKGNVAALKEADVITVPLKTERSYPECLKGFGWCTWNAFYQDVTADKILSKLEEFKNLGVKIKWMLIDDGWSTLDGQYLVALEEDRKRFPNGLKDLIHRAKSEYGIEYVGVWHAYTGYWDGIKPDSELAKKYEGKLIKTANGKLYPGGNEEYAYEFWSEWYSYLQAQGVDFVKVDNQSALQRAYDGMYPGASGTVASHSAHDKAVVKYFGGAVINCMGLTYEDIVTRPYTMINRNSDDFYPNVPTDFCHHTIQNAYNAVLQDELHNCDYDMFFSKHYTAVGSAVLRAISGGPVYISDEVGGTDKEVLSHLCTENGEIFMYDNAATVSPTCFFVDCENEKQPLKIYNKKGENIALAAFGVSPETTVSGTLTLKDIPDAKDKYLAHDFFQDKYFVFDASTEVPLKLDYNCYALYTLYPIAVDGTVSVGDKNFYAEGATPALKTANYKTFLD